MSAAAGAFTAGFAAGFAADFTVAAAHPAREGHFPGNPIVPGVLILAEALAAIERTVGEARAVQLKVVKFHAPARFGEPLRMDWSTTPQAGDAAVTFEVRDASRRIASGTIVLTPADRAPSAALP